MALPPPGLPRSEVHRPTSDLILSKTVRFAGRDSSGRRDPPAYPRECGCNVAECGRMVASQPVLHPCPPAGRGSSPIFRTVCPADCKQISGSSSPRLFIELSPSDRRVRRYIKASFLNLDMSHSEQGHGVTWLPITAKNDTDDAHSRSADATFPVCV